MKKFIFLKHLAFIIAYVLSTQVISAQDKGVYVEFKFESTRYSNNESLIATNENSKYSTSQIDSAFKQLTKQIDGTNNYNIQVGGNVDKSELYLNSNDNFGLIFYPEKKDISVVIDSLPDLIWNILPGNKKMIGTYMCEKAGATFRGTEIFAYFSPDLPFNFGPWKLKGLPGLILEAGVVNSPLNEHWYATKIVYPFVPSELPILDSSNKTSTTLKNYIISNDKKFTDKLNRAMARLPAGVQVTKTVSARAAIEKKYEWE